MLYKALVITTFLLIIGVEGAKPSICSGPNQDLAECLGAIRQRLMDPKVYRFPVDPETIILRRSQEGVHRSLAEQIFGTEGPIDLSSIDRLIQMTYTSNAGSFVGCDHRYDQDTKRTFTVDPLSGEEYNAWHLRDYPHITWNFTESEIFTEVTLDAFKLSPVSVFVNIPGNDFLKGLALVEYQSPLTPSLEPRPIVQMVYKQTKRVPLQLIESYGFNMTEFSHRNHLQGLVGITWVDMVTDPWSLEKYSHTSGQFCADYVKYAIGSELQEMPSASQPDLSVHLRVRFVTPEETYQCGKYNITQPAADIYADSISPDAIDASLVRSGMQASWEMNKVDPTDDDFKGKSFTLVMWNKVRFVHYLKVNIRGNDIDTGLDLLPYLGSQYHRLSNYLDYVFLLYEQTMDVGCVSDIYLAHSSTCVIDGRCFSRFDQFIIDNELKLVGLARVSTYFGEYSKCHPFHPHEL